VIRNSEEGYKLLTVQEKTWETKRNSLDPREADRNRIKREVLRQIFSDPQLRKYQYRKLQYHPCYVFPDGERHGCCEGLDPRGDPTPA